MLSINSERFKETFDRFSSFGATNDGGLNRPALSQPNIEARDALMDALSNLEICVEIDEVGNVFGRRPGIDSGENIPVLMGSHLDSQTQGGRFDGQLGVLAGLETLRALEDASIETKRPVELVCWTGEEGSRFDEAPLGSSTFAGELSVKAAKQSTDADGTTLDTALRRSGYAGNHPCQPKEFTGYLELHIEQGPTLYDANIPIGIGESVYGGRWLEVTIDGRANHAGTTPMAERRDPLQTAVKSVERMVEMARQFPDVVLTVGSLSVAPGSPYVVPGHVRFTVDIRGPVDTDLDEIVGELTTLLKGLCERDGTEYSITRLNDATQSVQYDSEIIESIKSVCEALGYNTRQVSNGAIHDSYFLTQLGPTGMIFVPSKDGISHNPAEFTSWSDCVDGAVVLANTVAHLATEATTEPKE